MLLDIGIILVVAAAAWALLRPSLARAAWWRAAVTPLASIIGSGFLILGPILNTAYGVYAPLVMGALCLVAYLFGAAIRRNIAALEQGAPRGRLETGLETAASWALAFAYAISVAYYLNLFGAFAVDLTPFNDRFDAKLVTSAVFLLIALVGWFHGFEALERLEYLSVTAKIAIIAGLLFALMIFMTEEAAEGALAFNPVARTGWDGLTLAFGLLITVQGFETSRYLGKHYTAEQRIRSMRVAQLVAATIYLIYIGMIAYSFHASGHPLTETAVIDLMRLVAPILPALLVAAALSAQFSAAIADTGGSGGLIAELTRQRISNRQGYVALVAIGVALTWTADVFEIINYASRAFALYYALQAGIAAIAAFRGERRLIEGPFFLALAALGLAIVVFGQAVEGSD